MDKYRNTAKTICDYSQLILIVFSPLFYASFTPLPHAISQTIALILFSSFLFYALRFSSKIEYPRYAYLLIFFVALTIFQIIPLPKGLVKLISPNRLNYLFSGDKSFLPLAFNLSIAKSEIVKILGYFLVFIAVFNINNKKDQFSRVLVTIIILGAALSIYGIAKRYLMDISQSARVSATFAVSDHFAGYLTMIVPISLGYTLYCTHKEKRLFFGICTVIMGSTIFLTYSRAGTASFVLSIIFMLFLLKDYNIGQNKKIIFSAVISLAALLILLSGIGHLRGRFLELIFTKRWLSRGIAYKSSLQIIRDFPLIGVGIGNFSKIYSVYREFAGSAYFYFLHNDHLQLIVESGLIGASAFFLFLGKLFMQIIGQLKKRRDPFVKTVICGCVCGLLGVILHAFFDFDFHIPAISFLFWILLAIAAKGVYVNFAKDDRSETSGRE